MDIQEETYYTLVQRLLNNTDSSSLVDWAFKLIENGYESESLFILASLNNDTTEEREKYFWKSIEELKIDVNKPDIELIENYALFIAKEVCAGRINPIDGLNRMQEILRASEYDTRYMQFSDLEEDLSYLGYEGTTIFNKGLTKENKEQFIKEEFKLFLEIEELQVNDSLRYQSFCNKCGQITYPKLKAKYQFKKPYKYYIGVCGSCGSQSIEHFTDQNGKRKFLQAIKNTAN